MTVGSRNWQYWQYCQRWRTVAATALAVLVIGLSTLIWSSVGARSLAATSAGVHAAPAVTAPAADSPSLSAQPATDHTRRLLTIVMLATAGGAVVLLALGHRRA